MTSKRTSVELTAPLVGSPTSAYDSHEKKLFFEKDFISGSGDAIPFVEPNVRAGFEDVDIKAAIQKAYGSGQVGNCCISTSCALTGIGLCYIWCNMVLIEEGSIGFVMHSGAPEMLLPGRYYITSPLSTFVTKVSHADDNIKVGPISIIRVPQGSVGLAYDNSIPEILLPGRHVRTSSTFHFDRTRSLQDEHIEFGPLKLLTVKSGGVRVCYQNGKAQIYREGRYAFNSSTFVVAGYINTQQQNVKFTRHKVLLDGGISLFVEGLMTFQVIDPVVLLNQLGEKDLLHALTQIAKAELARLFSMIHLEQISSAHVEKKAGEDLTESAEGETRDAICQEILRATRPTAEGWGVKVINFQLESTELADRRYAAEYEEASLEIAKARSARRAVEATNDILIQNSKAASTCLKIEAEGEKTAALIKAEARAEARRIEASGRQDGAKSMKIPFAKKFALGGQQVEFASALKAKVLTVVPGSTIGGALLNQAPFKA